MNRRILALVALLWTLSVITVSLMPMPFNLRVMVGTEPAHDIKRMPMYIKPPRHRLAHFVMFGVAEALYLGLVRRTRECLWAVLGLLALAVGIEAAQIPIFHLPRLEWWDIRDDIIGAAIAFGVWLVWKQFGASWRAARG